MRFSVSFIILSAQRACQVHVVGQECTNPGHQVAVANKFCAVMPNICRVSVWNLLCVTLLGPVIKRRHLGYWKIFAPLL
jgi:hypothetical protein